jgi:hypothetical protein
VKLKAVLATGVVASTLVTVPAAQAHVRLVSVSSPVRRGSWARLTVAVAPSKQCSITVRYQGRVARAIGLYPKMPNHGRVSWIWKVGTKTPTGRWPISISCRSAGRLYAAFVVR